jgi:hypothetical protein
MNAKDYTVCITNFERPEHLRRCLESVKHLPNVVVACFGAGEGHDGIINSARPGTPSFLTAGDEGCNMLWLQAVRLATTPWVVILHDDDQLVPEFEKALAGVDPQDAAFIGWDGYNEFYGRKQSTAARIWGAAPHGFNPTAPLLASVTQPNDSFVKSPVTMMLRRDKALRVLEWCEKGLKDCSVRPTMMIGNEIALLLGHLRSGDRWFRVARNLVRFGNWEGSETVKFLEGRNPRLFDLYNEARMRLGRSTDFPYQATEPKVATGTVAPAEDVACVVVRFFQDCGLGNQMFELAAGMDIASRLRLPLVWEYQPSRKRKFGLGIFGLVNREAGSDSPVVFERRQGCRDSHEDILNALRESGCRRLVFTSPSQSHECFESVAPRVRELFRLNPLPISVPVGKTPVALQVRRGDYVGHRTLEVTNREYFEDAVRRMKELVQDPHFFVVSDDSAWCSRVFRSREFTVMPPQTAHDGLRTMAACHAHIISNSSYGWWGAWLSEKGPVIGPLHWHNPRFKYEGWKPAPPHWIRIDNGKGGRFTPGKSLKLGLRQ